MRIFLGILFYLVSGWLPGHAQESNITVANGNGNWVTISVPPSSSATQEYVVYYRSKGKVTSSVLVDLVGPARLRGKVQFRKKGSAAPRTAAASSRGWIDMPLQKNLVVRDGQSNTSPATLPSRRTCTPQELQVIRNLIPLIPAWRGLTPEQICAQDGDGTPLPPDPGTDGGGSGPQIGDTSLGVKTVGVVYKDTCAKEKTYLVRAVVQIDRIDTALLQSGFDFQVAFTELPFKGRMAASIKPVSDGRFAPRPLLLMSTTGRYFPSAERLYLMQWQGERVRSVSELAIEDYIGYRGLQLSRSVLGSELRGGRGNFVLINDRNYASYSVCFDLARRRQKVNGYPG